MQDVAALLAEGAIWPIVAARFPLDRVADAHEALENSKLKGAVVVCVADARGSIGEPDVRAA
jgi:NADPH:quinone reductase-like Zn-dependent oxidoreductase